MEKGLEKPTEACGLVMTFEGGVGIKINFKSTSQKVIEKIQEHLSKGRANLIQFETTNPNEQEVCIFNPNKILAIIVTKEFVMGGRIVPATLASPGVNPNDLKH